MKLRSELLYDEHDEVWWGMMRYDEVSGQEQQLDQVSEKLESYQE